MIGLLPRKRKGICDKRKLQNIAFHLSLIIICFIYIILGAGLFYYYESANEIETSKNMIKELKTRKKDFINKGMNLVMKNKKKIDYDKFVYNMTIIIDDYLKELFLSFDNYIKANVVEQGIEKSEKNYSMLWNRRSSVLFSATTMVPVGFGLITPLTIHGKIIVIFYGIIGVPLALVTLSDVAKFFTLTLSKFTKQNMFLFVCIVIFVLSIYPLTGAYLIYKNTSLPFIESIFYCVTTIFTIGYGDFEPQINLVWLLLFVYTGVMLVTICVELIGLSAIHNIHYMGRQVNKFKDIAGKMVLLAQKININRGLGLGLSQLNNFAKFGIMMKIDENGNTYIEDNENLKKIETSVVLVDKFKDEVVGSNFDDIPLIDDMNFDATLYNTISQNSDNNHVNV
ncbi:Two pore domain potassium channel family and Two pore domain potassium channel domain-containing protein [Strongyloides ratti]|uniref:Two pore domain potassium channel family and Two pore domain potassium channel domain-containing protein n=1 Tax=Strongyloides ratti TaxID=34506 RepID=A0A090L059_STRRB|nr:Two pore domain potassium channel family and Two pore domain potassium channel domain-containing protein [Strongyloides ratti]CEF60859.1 Two pore domain potassium channel family and Two pore domain potassium channel domain-containing protein [Strongyloides ratti]